VLGLISCFYSSTCQYIKHLPCQLIAHSAIFITSLRRPDGQSDASLTYQCLDLSGQRVDKTGHYVDKTARTLSGLNGTSWEGLDGLDMIEHCLYWTEHYTLAELDGLMYMDETGQRVDKTGHYLYRNGWSGSGHRVDIGGHLMNMTGHYVSSTVLYRVDSMGWTGQVGEQDWALRGQDWTLPGLHCSGYGVGRTGWN